jgi:hypothetical protein
MSAFKSDGRFAPSLGLGFLQPAPNNPISQPRAAITRWLWNSAAPLGVLAFLSTPGIGQVVSEAERRPDTLGPVIVTSPQHKPIRRTRSGAQPAAGSARVAGRARPQTVAPVSRSVSSGHDGPQTPLNTNAIAASASRLGLTVREIPATVEVIDQKTIADRGYRSVSEVAQGAVGVTSGDNPAEPSAFSMRGFTNSQINTLYNGIKIGPQNMTSRVMDTANLESVEILKGPASLLSGEGASGGAINFVSRQPTSGPIHNEAFLSYDSAQRADRDPLRLRVDLQPDRRRDRLAPIAAAGFGVRSPRLGFGKLAQALCFVARPRLWKDAFCRAGCHSGPPRKALSI